MISTEYRRIAAALIIIMIITEEKRRVLSNTPPFIWDHFGQGTGRLFSHAELASASELAVFELCVWREAPRMLTRWVLHK